ncbi:MAG: putative integral membrane protein (TIGR00698 family) [Planctomycetota bacterium]|jgi:uncharacterized integral membrane protein (TIGR00698 family)
MLPHLMITVARVELSTAQVGLPCSGNGAEEPVGVPARGPGPRGRLLPGLLLAGGVAILATLLTSVLATFEVVAGSMVVSLLLGLTLANLRPIPTAALPGLDFACRPVLRFAIVLLGLRIGLPQVAAVGASGLLSVTAIVATTLAFGYWISRRLGLSSNLAWLLASGHAICGAAAIAAADSVLKAKDREVTQALTMVTLFGTVAMLVLPMLGSWLQLDAELYGFWVGGSVHEVAQAVASGYARGEACGEAASIIKLVRVAHLLPLGLLLGGVVARRALAGGKRRIIVPWFVLGFAAVAVFDAAGLVPVAVADALRQLCTFAMTVAMAALGLKSSLREVIRAGVRPLLAAGLTTAWIVTVAVVLAANLATID